MNKSILPVEAKVGLFLVVTALILFFVTFNVGKLGSIKEGGTDYRVHLPEAHGLIKDTVVEMDGVRVGKITGVSSDPDEGVWVEFVVEGPARVHGNAEVAVRASGLLGSRYLTVTRGSDAMPLIEDGGEIHKKSRSVDVDEILQRVSKGVDDLLETIGGVKNVLADKAVQEDLRDTVSSVRGAAAKLDQILGDFASRSPNMARDMEPMLRDLRATAADLRSVASRVNAWSDPLTASIDARLAEVSSLIHRLEDAAGEVSQTVNSINEGDGTIPMLINDEEVAANLAGTISGIKEAVESYGRFRTYFGYRGEYQYSPRIGSSVQGFKHWVTLDLVPSDTMWYTFQIVSDPEGATTHTLTTTRRLDAAGNPVSSETYRRTVVEDAMKYSLYFNKRFGDLALRLGLMESAGGWGITYNLLNDDLNFNLDVYDFRRTSLKGGGNFPIARGRISYTFLRYLQFNVSVSDFLNRDRDPIFSAGGSFYFNDEDLKLLLLSAPSIPQ